MTNMHVGVPNTPINIAHLAESYFRSRHHQQALPPRNQLSISHLGAL